MITIGSMCTGMGGLDMAAREVFGGRVAWHAEADPDASRVLAHHWPDVPNHGDIRATDWAAVEPVDVLTAGWPCQDISNAGKRAGMKEGNRSGLWFDIADAIRVVRPRVVVLENAAALLVRGLDRVTSDLAALGYMGSWTCVRASDVGAPHRRERVFVVAADATRPGLETGRQGRPRGGTTAHTQGDGRHEGRPEPARLLRGPDAPLGSDVDWGIYGPAIRRWEAILGRPAPAPTESGRTGKPRLSPTFVEWHMGLPGRHVTAVPGISRNAQLRLLGNGVVPQQAAAALRILLDRTTDHPHDQPEGEPCPSSSSTPSSVATCSQLSTI